MTWSRHSTPLVCLLLICLWGSAAEARIRHVYLTWQGDPSTTMSVNVQTVGPETAPPPRVRVVYDTVAAAAISQYRLQVPATRIDTIEALPGRYVHTFLLRDLTPGRRYFYRVLSATDAPSTERQFRTLETRTAPLRFVVGGDMGVNERAIRLQRAAAAQAPQFVVIGGDIAYDNGDWAEFDVWDRWFDNWDSLMVTPDGTQIPIVAAIGNHEVRGGYGGTAAEAPLYLRFLPQGTPTTYYERVLGPRVVLFVLDSGHLAPHGGAQARWLEEALARQQERPIRFAAYHVPLFPGFRQPSGAGPRAGRTHWQPLFEAYGLTAAFEHHDHVFKRTVPIRGGREDAGGILYLGDGAFGRGPKRVAGPRQVHLGRRWYLDRLEGRGHFWRVDIDAAADSVVFNAIDEEGTLFDRVVRRVR